MSSEPALDFLFHPRSVAVVGVTTDMSEPSGGRVFAETMLGFKGNLYYVGRGGGELLGRSIYRAVADIPDSLDMVISSIPAHGVPQLLRDSAARGARVLHMFTAGFSEIGTEEGRRLESEIVSTARQVGMRLVGPNCMGLYCPEIGLSFCTVFSHRSGPVGYMAQSGGHSLYGVTEGNARGIYFSKVASFGNAADLNECDFLEYLTADPATEIIGIYIEGMKEPGRFVAALKRASRLKPVVVYKGGRTQTGARTALSHTGSIAGSSSAWSALVRQAGAVEVHDVPELVDMLSLFRFMTPLSGKRAAVIGLGGGASVQATDDCVDAGLELPGLPPAMCRKLSGERYTKAGKIFQNPIDVFGHASPAYLQNIFDTLSDSGSFDVLVPHLTYEQYPVPGTNEMRLYIDILKGLEAGARSRIAVVLHIISLASSKQLAAEAQAELAEAGFPVFPSFSRAAKAISRYADYYRRRNAI